MEILLAVILGIILAILGINKVNGEKEKDVNKKIEKSKSEISKLDTAGLVSLANSILGSRSNNNKR